MFFSDASSASAAFGSFNSFPIVPRPCLSRAVRSFGGGDELVQLRVQAFVGHQLADRAAPAREYRE